MTTRSRQSARRHAPIACEVVRDEGFRLLGRTVLDLSESGLRVALDEPAMASALTVGEALWVSFRADHIGLWFDFEAEVARVSLGRRPDDDCAALAVRFLTRWDAGKAHTPALSRLLLRNGIAKLPKLVAPPGLRGKRSPRPPQAQQPTAEALLRASFQ